MATPSPVPPAELLEGVKLKNDWVVGKKRDKVPGETGGYFSIGYDCSRADGHPAFLKAIDLHTALKREGGDVLASLQPLVAGAQAEKDLLEECKTMNRVITAIEFGDIYELNGSSLDIPIPYIIFEKAETTARTVVMGTTPPLHAWQLRTLHHVAVGLSQLHNRRIAHQDVKLSNILLFKDKVGAKVSDLGRSVKQGRSVPHDQQLWPGAWDYAPPEFLYGYDISSEFNVRRLAADLYMLGSAACAIFTGLSMNALLFSQLPSEFHPPRLRGTYTGNYEYVLPYLEEAFDRVLADIRAKAAANAPYTKDIVTMISQWCRPNPTDRGHPRTRAIAGERRNAYSLDRYVTELDLLANKASVYKPAKI